MKDNTGWVGGKLKVDPTYRTAWALYFSKFLSAYATEGVEFWAVTVQNEPTASIGVTWESMLFEKAEEAGFIMDYLGPRLQHDHPGVAVIMMDDQKNLLPGWAAAVLGGAARKYVTGIGVHWYEGLIGQIHPGEHFSELEATHVQFPELFILGTEACQGFEVFQHGPVFDRERQWERGESYAHDICGDLLHWSGGWMDWNIVLDQQGGPNHAANFCDAPIIRMNDGNIVKQPMYYALGHFSRFIPPNSRRIGMKSEVNSSFEAPMEAVAFRTPSREIVVVVLNRDMFPHKYRIHDPTRRPNGYLHVAIPERAFHTVVYAAT
jgi:glucosylceramidase